MAPLIGYAVSFIGSLTWSSVVSFVARVAISYAISRALSPKTPKVGSVGNPIEMTKEPAPVRHVVIGEVRKSGPMAFAHVSGAKNVDLNIVIMLAAHSCKSITAVMANDQFVTFSGDGISGSGIYAGKFWARRWLGKQTTADAALTAATGGKWSSACILRGITALWATLKFDTELYPSGLPNLSVIMEGCDEIWDPRTDDTGYSRNPALVILWYLMNEDLGMGVDEDEIDVNSFIAAANVCDELVGGAPRYAIDAVFAVDGEPAAILEQMLGTMAGTIIYSGGKFTLKPGAYEAPEFLLTENMLIAGPTTQTAPSRRDICNLVRGTYSSPEDRYVERDFPQVRDDDAIAEDLGEVIPRDLALNWVTNPDQCQRLASIDLRMSRLGAISTFPCNLKPLKVRAGDTIQVSNSLYGWTDTEFFITEWRLTINEDRSLGVVLTGRRTDASVFEWAGGTTITPATPVNSDPLYPFPTFDDLGGGAPGTYDDLLGLSTGALPIVTLEGEESGGTGNMYGFTERTNSLVPRTYYLTKTLSGTTSAYYPAGHVEYIWDVGGADTISPETGAITFGGWYHYLSDYESSTDYEDTVYSSLLISNEGITGQTMAGIMPQIYAGEVGSILTPTSETVFFTNGGDYTNATGALIFIYSNEYKEEDLVARLLAENPWEAMTAITTMAVHSARVLRNLTYKKIRLRPTGGVITGLSPWRSYLLQVQLERRAYGSDGYGPNSAWADSRTLDFGVTADMNGNATIDWEEVVPERGYAERYKSHIFQEVV